MPVVVQRWMVRSAKPVRRASSLLLQPPIAASGNRIAMLRAMVLSPRLVAARCGVFEEAFGRWPGDRSRATAGRHVCPQALDGSVLPGWWQHHRTVMSHRRSPVEMMCVRSDAVDSVESTAPLSCLGECGSVVDPRGCEAGDDL
jgi:hypothetical protein